MQMSQSSHREAGWRSSNLRDVVQKTPEKFDNGERETHGSGRSRWTEVESTPHHRQRSAFVDLNVGFFSERQSTGQQNMQRHAQSPDVRRARVEWSLFEHLGRPVSRRSLQCQKCAGKRLNAPTADEGGLAILPMRDKPIHNILRRPPLKL